MRVIDYKKKIILIDNEIADLKKTATELANRDARFDVLATDNFIDATEYLKKEMPLIIMISIEKDYGPGHLITFFKTISQSEALSKIPIVLKGSNDSLMDYIEYIQNLDYTRIEIETSIHDIFEMIEFKIYKTSNESGSFLKFKKGDILFSQNDPLDELIVLYSGEAMAFQESEGEIFQMGLFKSPEIIGEIGVFQNGLKRTYSAKCLTECEVLIIKRDSFQEYLALQPFWLELFLSQLVNRMRNAETLVKK